MSQPFIFLDRDGVLNDLVVDEEQGTIDSPLHPSQVSFKKDAAASCAKLTQMGFRLAIVTNQPAAAKKKTTLENLKEVHGCIVKNAESAGGRIESSQICFHRKEDRCPCRKPAIGLLSEAVSIWPHFDRSRSWMVGDGLTDLLAGQRFGIKTCFLAAKKAEFLRVFGSWGEKTGESLNFPDFWCESLEDFVSFLESKNKSI